MAERLRNNLGDFVKHISGMVNSELKYLLFFQKMFFICFSFQMMLEFLLQSDQLTSKQEKLLVVKEST